LVERLRGGFAEVIILEGHAAGVVKGILDEEVYARTRVCRGDIRRQWKKV
jgi:hypothetical protein